MGGTEEPLQRGLETAEEGGGFVAPRRHHGTTHRGQNVRMDFDRPGQEMAAEFAQSQGSSARPVTTSSA